MELVKIRDFKNNNEIHNSTVSYFLNFKNNYMKQLKNLFIFSISLILASPSLSLNNIVFFIVFIVFKFLKDVVLYIKYYKILINVKRKEYSFNEVMIEKVEPKKWFSVFYKIILKDKDGNILNHPIKIGMPRMYNLKNHMFTNLYLIQLNTNKQYELLLI